MPAFRRGGRGGRGGGSTSSRVQPFSSNEAPPPSTTTKPVAASLANDELIQQQRHQHRPPPSKQGVNSTVESADNHRVGSSWHDDTAGDVLVERRLATASSGYVESNPSFVSDAGDPGTSSYTFCNDSGGEGSPYTASAEDLACRQSHGTRDSMLASSRGDDSTASAYGSFEDRGRPALRNADALDPSLHHQSRSQSRGREGPRRRSTGSVQCTGLQGSDRRLSEPGGGLASVRASHGESSLDEEMDPAVPGKVESSTDASPQRVTRRHRQLSFGSSGEKQTCSSNSNTGSKKTSTRQSSLNRFLPTAFSRWNHKTRSKASEVGRVSPVCTTQQRQQQQQQQQRDSGAPPTEVSSVGNAGSQASLADSFVRKGHDPHLVQQHQGQFHEQQQQQQQYLARHDSTPSQRRQERGRQPAGVGRKPTAKPAANPFAPKRRSANMGSKKSRTSKASRESRGIRHFDPGLLHKTLQAKALEEARERAEAQEQAPTKRNLMHCGDAPVHIALACCFIDDAMHGRLANGKNKMYFESTTVQHVFMIHTSQLWLHFVYAVAILLAALTFFEPPSASSFHPWTLGVEFFCIAVFITDIAMKVFYMGRKTYLSKNWHKMQLVFVALFLLDALVFAIRGDTLRFARFVRPAILLGRHRELRHTYFIISAMLPRLAKVFALMIGFIGFFGIIGIHVFADEYHNVASDLSQLEGTYDNFPRAFLRLFVLFTTENYPFVVEPAYKKNSATFIFYFVFVYAGVFFLAAMLLGLIVSTYFDYTARQIHTERKKEWRGLMRAFALLDSEGKGYVSMDTWFELLKYLRPDTLRKQAKFFFELLDRDGNGKLDCFDFLDLREIMLLKIRPTPASELTNTLQRRQWPRLRILAFNVTSSVWFHPCVLLFLTLNAAVACVYHAGISKPHLAALQGVHLLFSFLFLVEVVLSIIANDWYNYIVSKWNVADVLLVPIAFLFHCLSFLSFKWGHFLTLAGNCLLFIRLLWVSRDARFGLVLIWNIIEAVLHLSFVMFVVIYFFGTIGIEVFRGYTPADPTNAFFFDYGCNMGFETMGCACFTLFQVTTTSNWHEPMNDLIEVAGWGSAVYFVIFFIIINLVLMDLLVAVTIEAFLLAKRNFQGVSADEIHTAFVEIPEDEEEEAPLNSNPTSRRSTQPHLFHNDKGKEAVSNEKSATVLRLEADDLVDRARRRSFQPASQGSPGNERKASRTPVFRMQPRGGGGTKLRSHASDTNLASFSPRGRRSQDQQYENEAMCDARDRHQSVPLVAMPTISETLVDSAASAGAGDSNGMNAGILPSSSPTQTHLAPPCEALLEEEVLDDGQPVSRRRSSSSLAGKRRLGRRWSIKGSIKGSIKNRFKSILRRQERATDPTLYRVLRCKQSWRREIAGQDEALALIDEHDLDKMAKDARGIPIHMLHEQKYKRRSRKRHKAALRALEQDAAPTQTGEDDLALKKISPILQWWAESRRLQDEVADEDSVIESGRNSAISDGFGDEVRDGTPAPRTRRRSNVMVTTTHQRSSRVSLVDTTLNASLAEHTGRHSQQSPHGGMPRQSPRPAPPPQGTSLANFKFPVINTDFSDQAEARERRLLVEGEARDDDDVVEDAYSRPRAHHDRSLSGSNRPGTASQTASATPTASGARSQRLSPRIILRSRSPSPGGARTKHLTPPNATRSRGHSPPAYVDHVVDLSATTRLSPSRREDDAGAERRPKSAVAGTDTRGASRQERPQSDVRVHVFRSSARTSPHSASPKLLRSHGGSATPHHSINNF